MLLDNKNKQPTLHDDIDCTRHNIYKGEEDMTPAGYSQALT